MNKNWTFLFVTSDSNKKTEESEMKKPKRTTGASGCQFYTQGTQEEIKDRIAVEALDIEQLVDLGRELKACPYYGTRHSVPFAQVFYHSYFPVHIFPLF